jgi:hypothetical protein
LLLDDDSILVASGEVKVIATSGTLVVMVFEDVEGTSVVETGALDVEGEVVVVVEVGTTVVVVGAILWVGEKVLDASEPVVFGTLVEAGAFVEGVAFWVDIGAPEDAGVTLEVVGTLVVVVGDTWQYCPEYPLLH